MVAIAGAVFTALLLKGRGLSLAGAILVGVGWGGIAVPAYFVANLLLDNSADRDNFAYRLSYFSGGLLMAVALGYFGIKLPPANVSIYLILGTHFWFYGFNDRYWGLLLGLAAVLGGCSYFGVANAPLAAICLLSSVSPRPQRETLISQLGVEVKIKDNTSSGDAAISFGCLCAAFPALSVEMLLDRAADIDRAKALGLGFSLGYVLNVRGSGVTPLGAMMAQFSPNIDVLLTIGSVAATGIVCYWLVDLDFGVESCGWLQDLGSLISLAWYLAIGNFFISCLIALGLYGVSTIASKKLPARSTFALSAAPILFL